MHSLLYQLKDKVALVIGCGGLGCYVVEQLARCGIYKLIVVDYDKFEESNINRQIYCTNNTLGLSKVQVAKDNISNFSNTLVVALHIKFNEKELLHYADEVDIIIDCVDNVKIRYEIEDFASRINVPLIHGAINGVVGQITTIMPNRKMFHKIYKNIDNEVLPTMAHIPALVASLQVAETIKVLNGLPTLEGNLLIIDTISSSFRKIDIKNEKI